MILMINSIEVLDASLVDESRFFYFIIKHRQQYLTSAERALESNFYSSV